MQGGSLKIFYAKPLSQRFGPHRFDVPRPQLFQAPSRIVRRHEFRFPARMKAEQQSLEIGPEKNKLQTLAALNRIWVAAGGAILLESIRI